MNRFEWIWRKKHISIKNSVIVTKAIIRHLSRDSCCRRVICEGQKIRRKKWFERILKSYFSKSINKSQTKRRSSIHFMQSNRENIQENNSLSMKRTKCHRSIHKHHKNKSIKKTNNDRSVSSTLNSTSLSIVTTSNGKRKNFNSQSLWNETKTSIVFFFFWDPCD